MHPDPDELFVQLLGVPPEERHGKLRDLCDSESVCDQVIAYLDADHQACESAWLEKSPLDGVTANFDDTTTPYEQDASDDDTVAYVPSNDRAEPSSRSIGEYEIISLLGEGAFGAVYLCNDVKLRRSVAVKVLRGSRSWSKKQTADFLSEAQNVARISHPHIVTVHYVGQCEQWGPYIVMEHVDGKSLKQRIAEAPMTVEHTCRVLAEVAEGLHAISQSGQVHRDLKPANILLDKNGVAKITDFGLAVRREDQMHRMGEFAGTLRYMAPEQIRTRVPQTDGRTDVWALGVVLYLCLSGKTPFDGKSFEETTREILEHDPWPLSQGSRVPVPQDLENLCHQCLEKEIGKRPRSGLEVSKRLRKHVPVDSKLKNVQFMAVTFVAFAAAFTAAIWYVGTSPSRVESGPETMKEPEPLRESNLLVAAPTELIWKKQDSFFDGHKRRIHESGFSESRQRFVLQTVREGAFRMGNSRDDESLRLHFNFELNYVTKNSRIAVFWGLEKREGGIHKLECVKIDILGGVARLQEHWLKSPAVHDGFQGGDLLSQKVDMESDIGQDLSVKLQIYRGELQKLEINGNSLPLADLDQFRPLQTTGDIGIIGVDLDCIVTEAWYEL